MDVKIKDRVKEYLVVKGIRSIRAFEAACGLSNGYINNVKSRIYPDMLAKISNAYPDLNTDWLIHGEGKMLKGSLHNSMFCPELSSVAYGDPNYKVETEDKHKVLLIPTSAQAGTLSQYSVGVDDWQCEYIISPIADADYAITVHGDSMMPDYPSGSLVLIKKINERAFIHWGTVYVLDTCNGVVMKRIMPGNKEGCLVCESINEKYPPFEIEMSQDILFGIYRVMMMMNMK